MKRQARPRRRPGVLHRQVARAERAAILEALHATVTATWNVTRAAKALGLPLSTMRWKMRRHKIRRP